MDQLNIRRADQNDRETLAEIFCSDIRDCGPVHQPAQMLPLVDATLQEQSRSAHCWIARTDQGEVAGVILAFPIWSLKVANRALWIEAFYVRPNLRRHGIGRKLLDFLLDWAYENDIMGVEVEAYRMSNAASILFRAAGFQRLAHERYCYHFVREQP
ncbi:MAG: GNAT family N-acetyltransferase [Bradymonadales bacterium]|nr:GNAT family N-acetyltransferase [Bradymonadales bacterium]